MNDLLSDTAGEVAPRIQAIGTRLWEMVREDPEPVITLEHYRDRLGGARGILARLLDEAIEDLSSSDEGVATELLRALTHLPGSPTSRPAPQSELFAYDDWERRERVLATDCNRNTRLGWQRDALDGGAGRGGRGARAAGQPRLASDHSIGTGSRSGWR